MNGVSLFVLMKGGDTRANRVTDERFACVELLQKEARGVVVGGIAGDEL